MLSFRYFYPEYMMIQMSVPELANLKTKKWIFPVFYGFQNRDSNTKAWKIYLEPLELCCRAWSRELQPTYVLFPDGGNIP
jgi:hypothetical protein